MTIKPQLAAAIWLVCFCPTMAATKDVALVIPSVEPGAQPSENAIHPATNEWPSVTSQFAEAGFEVLIGEADNINTLKMSYLEIADDLGNDSSDRLVIVADASFIADTPSGWLFFGPEDEVFVSELEQKALRISDFDALTKQAKGPVVVLVVTRDGSAASASRFRPANSTAKDSNVIYVSVGAEGVARFLQNGLLRKGASFADLKTALPARASIDGYLSRDLGFMGPAGRSAESIAGEELIAAEEKVWQSALELGTKDAMELYLTLYPEGLHVESARRRIAEIGGGTKAATPEIATTKDIEAARAEEAALELNLDQRIVIQEYLDILGMDPGIIDGKWEDEARAAIRDWQLWSEFPVTGYVNAKQIGLMRTQAAEQMEREKEDEMAQERIDREYWQATGQRGSEQELHAYLERFPNGLFADLAYQRLAILDESIQQMQRQKNSKSKTVKTPKQPAPKAAAPKKQAAAPAKEAPARARAQASAKASEQAKPKAPSNTRPPKTANARDEEDAPKESVGFFESIFGKPESTPTRPDPKEPAVARAPANEPPVVKPKMRDAPAVEKPQNQGGGFFSGLFGDSKTTAPAEEKPAAKPPKVVKKEPTQQAPVQKPPVRKAPSAPEAKPEKQNGGGFFGGLFDQNKSQDPKPQEPKAKPKAAPSQVAKTAPAQPAPKQKEPVRKAPEAPQAEPQNQSGGFFGGLFNKKKPAEQAVPAQKPAPKPAAKPATKPAQTNSGGGTAAPTQQMSPTQKKVASDQKFKIITDLTPAEKPRPKQNVNRSTR